MRLSTTEIKRLHAIEETQQIPASDFLGNPPSFARFTEPVKIRVKAKLTGSDILVEGSGATRAVYNCARCLTDFNANLAGEFVESFPMIENDVIDLTENLRECVLLNLPLNAVCSEKCKGLCPTCGANRNKQACRCTVAKTDERWDKLKQFRFE